MADTKNIFNATEDNSIPLEDILNGKDVDGVENVESAKENKPVEKEKELTPLQMMSKETSGIVYSNEELEAGKEKAPSTDIVNTDAREEEWKKKEEEYDEMNKKRNALTLVHQPVSQEDYFKMMDEIESLQFDKDGKPFFPPMMDNFGNNVEPYFVRIKKDGDSDFDIDSLLKDNPEYAEQYKNRNKDSNTKLEDSKLENNESNDNSDDSDDDNKKIVKVLIDKTGFGANFNFTKEEREKIDHADIIKVNEIKKIDINAIRAKKNNKSFQELTSEFNTNGNRTTIYFPASGFRAQMKGLTYGEYGDISLSMENINFERYRKRLSIIYNKMTNTSCTPFKDFEDFLHHFSYTDINLALYAIFVSTESEEKIAPLTCGKCNQDYNWTYSPRSIFKFDQCSPEFNKKMNELTKMQPSEYDKFRDEADVNNVMAVELPDSHYVVELGLASAYELLYNFIPLMDEETFKEAFGDDLNELYLANTSLLLGVRRVWVPDGNGGYTECAGYKDILESLYSTTTDEIKFIASYIAKLQEKYDYHFSFGRVTCPHCHNVTENLEVSMDELFFRTFQQSMNTEIDVMNLL